MKRFNLGIVVALLFTFVFSVAAVYGVETRARIHDRQTGAEAIEYSLSSTGKIVVTAIRVHFDAAGTTSENLSVSIASATANAYDVVIYTIDIQGVSDVVYAYPIVLDVGDELVVGFTNTDTLTYGLEVVYEY